MRLFRTPEPAARAQGGRPAGGARLSQGTVALGFALALALTLETGQILVEAREFSPNLGSARLAVLRSTYWPEAPVPTDDQGVPLKDWIGLERYLAQARLDPVQARALEVLENDATGAADRALEAYAQLLDPLTPSQRRALKAPQPRVVDAQALGLDSVSRDLMLLWLHRMDERASQARESARARAPEPGPDDGLAAMAPSRLAVGLTRLLDDPHEPLTPAQARALRDRMLALRTPLAELHALHLQAVNLLTEEQRGQTRGLELRRWEPYPSPRGLRILLEQIRSRREGGTSP